MNNTGDLLIQEFKSSGLTQQEFCEQRSIPVERLRYHLYKKGQQRKSCVHRGSSPFVKLVSSEAVPVSRPYTIIFGQFTIKELTTMIDAGGQGR